MKKLIYLSILLVSHFSISQVQEKTENTKKDSVSITYDHGASGIEFVFKTEAETTIVSTFNAKPIIKSNIAQKVLDFYKTNIFLNGDSVKILGTDADVTGKLIVEKKGKLTTVNFHYEKIDWKSGLVEVYKR